MEHYYFYYLSMTCPSHPIFSNFHILLTTVLFHYHSRKFNLIINQNLQYINNWLSCTKIQINISKTKYMLYSCCSVADLESISIDIGQIILHSTCMHFLGIFIDEHLNFTQHVNHICSKVYKSSIKFYMFFHKIPLFIILRSLYFPYIIPYCLYDIKAWFGCPDYNKNRMVKHIHKNHV